MEDSVSGRKAAIVCKLLDIQTYITVAIESRSIVSTYRPKPENFVQLINVLGKAMCIVT